MSQTGAIDLGATFGGGGSGGSGVDSLNTLTGDLTLVAGSGITILPGGSTITITNTGGAPTGDPNTFTGFDASGNQFSIPGWSFNPLTSGLSQNTTLNVPPDAGVVFNTENQMFMNIELAQDTTQYSTNVYGFVSDFDAANSGFNFAGQLDVFRIDDNIHGSGALGNRTLANFNQNFGDGNGGSADNSTLSSQNTQLQTGYTLAGYDYNYHSMQLDGTITNNLRLAWYDLNGSGSGTVKDMNALFGAYISNNITVTEDMGFFQVNNSAPVGRNLQFLNVSNQANVAGNITGLNLGFNSGTVGGDLQMINAYNNSGNTITGDYTGMNLSNSANVTGSMTGLNLNFNGVGGGTVNGMNINLNNVSTPGKQKAGLNINDGALSVDSSWVTNREGLPGGEFQQNDISGEFNISAGVPMNDGSFGFGNNLGITILAEDDMGDDATGLHLGYSVNGFVNQIGVLSGKTMQTVNYMMAGGGISSLSTGGNVVNLSLFRALGFLPEGGTLAITNLYGFKADQAMDFAGATNTWGVYVGATSADNYFAKNVVIGGSTGQPTGAYALDVTGVITVNNNNIINVLDPVNPQDAATKNYVDTGGGNLKADGSVPINGTLLPSSSDNFDFGSSVQEFNNIYSKNFIASSSVTVSTLNSVGTINDNGSGLGLNSAVGISIQAPQIDMSGSGSPAPIINMLDPANPQDAATKHYVDTKVAGASGTFTTTDLKTVTVVNGLITSIV